MPDFDERGKFAKGNNMSQGRPKGAKNKLTLAREAMAMEVANEMSKLTAVEYLQLLLEKYIAIGDHENAAKTAEKLAPYQTPKLSSQDMNVSATEVLPSISVGVLKPSADVPADTEVSTKDLH